MASKGLPRERLHGAQPRGFTGLPGWKPVAVLPEFDRVQLGVYAVGA